MNRASVLNQLLCVSTRDQRAVLEHSAWGLKVCSCEPSHTFTLCPLNAIFQEAAFPTEPQMTTHPSSVSISQHFLLFDIRISISLSIAYILHSDTCSITFGILSRSTRRWIQLITTFSRDSPGSLVVRMPCFHCEPCSQKKKKKKKTQTLHFPDGDTAVRLWGKKLYQGGTAMNCRAETAPQAVFNSRASAPS